MYVFTNDAERTLSDSERRRISVAAVEYGTSCCPRIGEILRSSIRQITALSQDNLFRMTAELLHKVRTTYLETAPPDRLRHLVAQCVLLGNETDLYALGIGTEDEVLNAVAAVATHSEDICKAGLQAVNDGCLLVENGKIVDPNRSARPEGAPLPFFSGGPEGLVKRLGSDG